MRRRSMCWCRGRRSAAQRRRLQPASAPGIPPAVMGSRPAPPTRRGPLAQSVRIGFHRAVCRRWRLLARGWLQQYPPGAAGQPGRGAALRPRSSRVQEAGLLLAWPRPIEQVVLLPARRAADRRSRCGGQPRGAVAEETDRASRRTTTSSIAPEQDVDNAAIC